MGKDSGIALFLKSIQYSKTCSLGLRGHALGWQAAQSIAHCLRQLPLYSLVLLFNVLVVMAHYS
jgi:hypothetical protein